jgi:hypothetical protein
MKLFLSEVKFQENCLCYKNKIGPGLWHVSAPEQFEASVIQI